MKKYFVIGNPIDHSLSPKLHNHWFKENKIDAIYDKRKIDENDLIKKIKLYENGFNFCPEITAQFSKINEEIYEVPINYYGRTHDQGKKIYFYWKNKSSHERKKRGLG